MLIVTENTKHHSALVVVCRGKDELCSCGCRGWCSMYVILLIIKWMANAGAEGTYPKLRHDGSHFNQPWDEHRSNSRGLPLEVCIAILEFKADWPALCECLCLRSWSHNLSPCFGCNVSKDRLGDMNNVCLDNGPWDDYTDEDLKRDIERSEIVALRTKPNAPNLKMG